MGIKTVPHHTYSPDVGACDFCLFPKPTGCCYETIEEMKEVATKIIDTLRQEDFHGAFEKLLEQEDFHRAFEKLLLPEEITSKGTKVSCVYYQ